MLEQGLTRQAGIEIMAIASGFHIAGIYREKVSGDWSDKPELIRMLAGLQLGDVVIAEKLIASIRGKDARLTIPGIVDLSELVAENDGVSRIVLESVQ